MQKKITKVGSQVYQMGYFGITSTAQDATSEQETTISVSDLSIAKTEPAKAELTVNELNSVALIGSDN